MARVEDMASYSFEGHGYKTKRRVDESKMTNNLLAYENNGCKVLKNISVS